MKKMLAALILAILAPRAFGDGAPVAIAGAYDPGAPAVRLQVPADYVAIPVSIESEQKDDVKRTDALEQAMRALADAVAHTPGLTLRPGVVSLAARKVTTSFGEEEYGHASASLYVLGALKPGVTVFSVARQIRQAVSAAHLGDDVHVSVEDPALALDDPEKYRAPLLSSLPKAVAETRKALGVPLSFELDGLENPVSVMRLNERDVLVFINYRLSFQSKKP